MKPREGEREQDGHTDPIAQEHINRAQDDYERALGWGVD